MYSLRINVNQQRASLLARMATVAVVTETLDVFVVSSMHHIKTKPNVCIAKSYCHPIGFCDRRRRLRAFGKRDNRWRQYADNRRRREHVDGFVPGTMSYVCSSRCCSEELVCVLMYCNSCPTRFLSNVACDTVKEQSGTESAINYQFEKIQIP